MGSYQAESILLSVFCLQIAFGFGEGAFNDPIVEPRKEIVEPDGEAEITRHEHAPAGTLNDAHDHTANIIWGEREEFGSLDAGFTLSAHVLGKFGLDAARI